MKYLLLGFFIASAARAFAQSNLLSSEGQKLKLENVLVRGDIVWGFDFLSPTEMLFTERGGKLFHFDLKTKKVTELMGTPKVYSEGQGGLLDVSVWPGNSKNKTKRIFFSYSLARDGKNTTAVGSATLENLKLSNVKTIFEANAWTNTDLHYGSRIVWESPAIFFLSVGERNEREMAQLLNNHHGKVLRLTVDGKAAPGNPYTGKAGALPEIWSYGHRNPQGLTMDAKKNLLEAEMGPRGGDEINLIKKGTNYGWPVVTYGREYHGPKIGEGTHKAGMQDPLVHWVPSISPSGITVYTGDKIPQWKNNVFLGNLSGAHLRRVVFDDKFKVVKQESLLAENGWRIRAVKGGPDGNLYLSTDQGVIARITP